MAGPLGRRVPADFEHVERYIPARHGTISKYNGGCKCDPCRLAQNTYQRERRHRLREVASAR